MKIEKGQIGSEYSLKVALEHIKAVRDDLQRSKL